MIKTLRITSIAAVVLAGAILAFPMIFGIRSDPKAQEFLKSVDAVEKFSRTQSKQTKSDIKTSPLVAQADNFGLFLNPPKAEPKPGELQAMIKPAVVAPKFTLVGTSIFPARPEKSIALIDEVGKGLHWIKQASKIGYVTVKQINDGSIVISDGSKTSEIVAERPEKVSLLRKPPSGKNAPANISTLQMAAQAPEQPESPNPLRQEQLTALANALQTVEQDVNSGKLDPNAAAEKTSAIMEKFRAEAEARRSSIGSEEANNIGLLGSRLQAQQDSNAAKPQLQDAKTKQSASDKTGSSTAAKPPRPRNPRRRAIRTPANPPPGASGKITDPNAVK